MNGWVTKFALLTFILIFLTGCANDAVNQTAVPSSGAPTTNSPLPASSLIPNVTNAPTQAPTSAAIDFDGQRAMQDVDAQMALGPRVPGSEAHQKAIDYFLQQLKAAGWSAEVQQTEQSGHPVHNVIAKRGNGSPWIIVGAHFDSRMAATQDPDPAKRSQPVPAANDGASGAAVLLELARVLPNDLKPKVWLAFFDVEDQGDLPGWDWILGSRALANSLTTKPDAVIVIDMIGDKNLNIYQERNSDPEYTHDIWATATSLGYEQQFIPQLKYSMEDDHTPFLEKGIRAVDIIDFDYPYWHTTEDTSDKVSPDSLEAVGKTLQTWILSK